MDVAVESPNGLICTSCTSAAVMASAHLKCKDRGAKHNSTKLSTPHIEWVLDKLHWLHVTDGQTLDLGTLNDAWADLVDKHQVRFL